MLIEGIWGESAQRNRRPLHVPPPTIRLNPECSWETTYLGTDYGRYVGTLKIGVVATVRSYPPIMTSLLHALRSDNRWGKKVVVWLQSSKEPWSKLISATFIHFLVSLTYFLHDVVLIGIFSPWNYYRYSLSCFASIYCVHDSQFISF